MQLAQANPTPKPHNITFSNLLLSYCSRHNISGMEAELVLPVSDAANGNLSRTTPILSAKASNINLLA